MNKTKWRKVFDALIDPMTLLPMILGILFALLTLFVADSQLLITLFTLISAIGIGVGVNYFTFYYKQQKENEILNFKAEHTVRSINLVINTILRRSDKTSNDNKNTIDSLLNIIDYWKDYYSVADTSQIDKLKMLREQYEDEADTLLRTLKEKEYENLQYDVSIGGLSSYLPLSGSTKSTTNIKK